MDTIDLRSDTVTLPTREMMDAMAVAPLGDDVLGEDPTVNKLETMAAQMLGKQAAMLVSSGTMGNLVSLMAHTEPGDEVLVDSEAHIFYYEAGGMASVAGLMPMLLRSDRGILNPKDVAAAIRPGNVHYPTTRLLCLENTHNRGGGSVVPLDLHQELCAVAHDRGLRVHLDGARIFNASIAAGVSAAEYARGADSIMFCLSKGLSCPVGSILAGDSDFIQRARRCRKRIGGGMRQAGIIAAAGVVALESMIHRLADDHASARALADGLSGVGGIKINPGLVQTNIVMMDCSDSGFDAEQLVGLLRGANVLANATSPQIIRLVTHRHVDVEAANEAARRIRIVVEGS